MVEKASVSSSIFEENLAIAIESNFFKSYQESIGAAN
jgi:hypothetical protein